MSKKYEFDFGNAYNGSRLTKMMRACVHSSGRLNFPPEAVRTMGLSLEKELLICPMGEKDLAVTVIEKSAGDSRGFCIRKTGPYFYVPFKSLLTELGIDFKNNTVVFDIIEIADTYNGSPVYKFNRRIIEHVDGESAEDGGVQGDTEEADKCAEGVGVPGEAGPADEEGPGAAGG